MREAGQEQIFGGKASALARALNAGLPVPEGFALGWSSAARFAEGDAATTDAIVSAIAQYRLGRVGVRSSAVGEDSADASFAGQHASILNVASAESILSAIREIAASGRTSSALEYRKRMRVEGEPRVAIVVQCMVESDCAGVLFTINPMSGENERVIESAWGLGEAVVAGLVTPDLFRVTPAGVIVERRAGYKDLAIRFAAEGTTEVPLAAAEIGRLTLDDRQLHELNALAARCETFFGAPQDLEWAYSGGRLFLLQSRPITTGAARR